MPERLVWSRLHLPAPLAAEAARAAVQALAALSGQPRIVLETIGRDRRVQWRIASDVRVHHRVLRAMQPHLPDMRSEPTDAIQRVALAARLALPGHHQTPLAVEQIEPVTRSLLAALSQAGAGEAVRLQLILGDRRRPHYVHLVDGRPHLEAAQRRDLTLKKSQLRLGASLRIAASTDDPARARTLIEGVAAALRGLEAAGVRIALRRATTRSVESVSSPYLWPLELGLSEVTALLGWPISADKAPDLPGVPARHPVLIAPTAVIPRNGRALGVAATDLSRTVGLSVVDSRRHLHLLGPTGVGKSTLMANLALQDISAGHGVVVIDPKGDLVSDLLARIPAERQPDVVVLDPTDPAPVGLASLGTPETADLSADSLLAVFHSLYADSWGPRTHDILHACLLSLARRGDASLAMVPLLLTHTGFRRSIVRTFSAADPIGLGSFWGWFESISDAERSQAIAPLMNKLRPLLLRPGLRAVVGQRHPAFSLSDVFTKRRILLVSLAKGSLGSEGAHLLGSLVVSLLWQAALERSRLPASRRHPVFTHIDEVQDYLRLPGDLGDALAQARGLGVGFTLAHQHLDQLPKSLRAAIFANARSRVAFGLSPDDARTIAKTSHGSLVAEDFQALGAFAAYAQLHVAGQTAPWCSIRTQPLPTVTGNPAAVQAASRSRYGRPLDEVERDLLQLMDASSGPATPLGRSRPGASASQAAASGGAV